MNLAIVLPFIREDLMAQMGCVIMLPLDGRQQIKVQAPIIVKLDATSFHHCPGPTSATREFCDWRLGSSVWSCGC